MNTLDIIVIYIMALSILIPVLFISLGWMKTNQINEYKKSLRVPYFWFALYGLVRWLMV